MNRLARWFTGLDRRVQAGIAAGLVLVVTLAGTAVVLAVRGRGATAVAKAPDVTFNLADGATEVPLDQKLIISFRRAVPFAELQKAVHLVPAAEGTLSDSGDSRTFIWTPARPYQELTRYSLSVDSFKDTAGHQLKGAQWSFTTTAVTGVLQAVNDAGVKLADGFEIPAGSGIKITFRTDMDPAQTSLMVAGKPAQAAWSDPRTATISTKGLAPGRIEIDLADGGKDRAGRPINNRFHLRGALYTPIVINTTPVRAPAIVQIPNDPQALDQSGIQAADIVYEYLTEFTITRFSAVYTRVPESIGPVRSARLISIPLTRMYHGRLYYSGVSEGTQRALNQNPVPGWVDGQTGFYRSGDRLPPNNLFLRGSDMVKAQAGLAEATIMHAAPDLTGPATPGDVVVAEHDTVYHYDPATGFYTKKEGGHPYIDAALRQPLRIQMLIVMHTAVTFTPFPEDVNGVRGRDFDTNSGGKVEIYYLGQTISGRWSHVDPNSPFTFTTEAGSPVTLPSGLTWIDVTT